MTGRGGEGSVEKIEIVSGWWGGCGKYSMNTLIVTTKQSYTAYANYIADKLNGTIYVSTVPQGEKFWPFVKEKSCEFGAENIILIGKSNVLNKTYQLRNTKDIFSYATYSLPAIDQAKRRTKHA